MKAYESEFVEKPARPGGWLCLHGGQLLQQMHLSLVAGFIVQGVDDHAAERAVARGGADDTVEVGVGGVEQPHKAVAKCGPSKLVTSCCPRDFHLQIHGFRTEPEAAGDNTVRTSLMPATYRADEVKSQLGRPSTAKAAVAPFHSPRAPAGQVSNKMN
jgi:hypothetical protein